jgi:hypothetical protein
MLKVNGMNPFNDLERTNIIKNYQQGNLKALRGYMSLMLCKIQWMKNLVSLMIPKKSLQDYLLQIFRLVSTQMIIHFGKLWLVRSCPTYSIVH